MNNNPISDELLSKILGRECEDAILANMDESYLEYWVDEYNDDYSRKINIYELAHKCKEWALKQKYYIKSQVGTEISVANIFASNNRCDENITANTEPEAIFKACEWILENASN